MLRLRRSRGRLLAAAVLALVACAAPPPLPPGRTPLAAIAAAGRPLVDAATLDFGTPAARERLISGWGPDETTAGGTFVWSTGGPARLVFDVVEPRSLALTFRAWSFPFAAGSPQHVTISLNGEELERRALAPRPESLTLAIPRAALRLGENELVLAAERHDDRPGGPPWAVAWESLQVEPAAHAGQADRPRFEGETLVLPGGTGIEWARVLPPGSVLSWDGLVATGGTRLLIDRFAAEKERARTARARAGQGGRVALLPGGGEARLVGFRLRAVGRGGEARIAAPALRHTEDQPRSGAPTTLPAGPAKRPHLLVYLIDTLRADHLGCYGYDRPTSPAIDAFARGAVLFENGRAQAPWTKPAVASVLTGLYPVTHRAELKRHRIPERIETASERLAAAGYETALFTTNANVTSRFGFAQGWDSFRYLATPRGRKKIHASSAEINTAVFDWLDRRDPEAPFFLFVHTLDPHDPYRPDEPFRARLAAGVDVESACCGSARELGGLSAKESAARAAGARQLYDAEIAQNDAAFGALLAELERRGLADSTAVLLLSDHGEEFLDHGGWKHGWTLYEEMLRVPFLLRLPGGAHGGRRLTGPAEQVDVLPTLLALAGLPPASELPGRNLLAGLAGPPDGTPRPSFAWLTRPNFSWASVTQERFKLVRFRGAWTPPLGRPPTELYDLAADPRETRDLALVRRLPRLWLDGALGEALAHYRPAIAAEETPIDRELERALRALGYV